MNIAIILAGGTGTRIGYEIPKQYIEVNKKPIISYCIEQFENSGVVDSIIIVCSSYWENYLDNWVGKKFIGYAAAGNSRQESIRNGLIKAKENGAKSEDLIIIHDAARPNVSVSMIEQCISFLESYDGVMPVLKVKDTVYYSKTGKQIDSLLDRDTLYAGQSPEGFAFGKYYEANIELNSEQLALIKGSSEIAFKKGLRIALIPGDENNYKITTAIDLEKFRRSINESI